MIFHVLSAKCCAYLLLVSLAFEDEVLLFPFLLLSALDWEGIEWQLAIGDKLLKLDYLL
jgi:hypothetical protein